VKNNNINHQKTVSVCIIGKPNAGKSSLLNKIIGQKISIVTPKVQTTRSMITGIVTLGDAQIIMFDTPGIFEPSGRLEKSMVRCAWSSLNSADIVMLVIDITQKFDQFTISILEKLKHLKIQPIFLLNKIDLSLKYIEYIENYLQEHFKDNPIFKISALSGKNIDKLISYIVSKAKNTPWLYEEDDMTNLPMRFLASEITREQLFLKLYEELPYRLSVQTEQWQENKDKSIKIHQVIIVSRQNYKIIILGKNGSMIKEIGSKARLEMEKFFGCKVHLFLFVKVRELWEETQEFYDYMGLKFEKSK
jgi:GTP-binding protein Era